MHYSNEANRTTCILNGIEIMEKAIPVIGRLMIAILNCKSKDEALTALGHSSKLAVPLPVGIKALIEAVDFDRLKQSQSEIKKDFNTDKK